MEIRHRIIHFSNDPKYALLQTHLDELGAQYKIKRIGSIGGVEKFLIEFVTFKSDPLYPRIEELIRENDFFVQSGAFFSEKEIDEAAWLYASVGEFQYPQPERSYIEGTYDITNYCPFCGMGAVQNNPFRLKSDFKQKAARFLGLLWVHDVVFVRPEVKKLFEKAGIREVEYSHPIHHKSGKPIETVYQMQIKTVARGGLISKGLNAVTCKKNNEEGLNMRPPGGCHGINRSIEEYKYCGRVKYHYPMTTMIEFRKSVLDKLPDVAMSEEYFGSGGAADNLILISRRFADLVKEYKLRGLKFRPIKIV
jgi:hypothetical protein